MPFSAYAEQHMLDQLFGGGELAQVSTALTAGQTAVTSIATATASHTVAEALSANEMIVVSYGTANAEVFQAAATSAGATSITVTSQTSAKAHAVGDLIVRVNRLIAPGTINVGLGQQGGTLTTALTSGTAYTSLAVTALSYAIASGDKVLIGTGTTVQVVNASAAAAAGATSITVTSFTANANYATGTPVSDASAPVEPSGNAYARVAVTNNITQWPVSTGADPATKQNASAVTFPTVGGTGQTWGTVHLVLFYDAATAGNLLGVGAMTTVQTLNSGGQLSFAANQITITQL